MHELIKKLKGQNYRLIIFSGNIRERITFLDKRYGFSKYFDDYLYSFDYEINKDDIRFYKELLKHINCEPNEAILIDDEKKNINYAHSIGLNGILYYYTQHLVDELRKYNVNVNM